MPHHLNQTSLPSKISFNNFLTSSSIFFYDFEVEKQFNSLIEQEAIQIRQANIGHGKPTEPKTLLQLWPLLHSN